MNIRYLGHSCFFVVGKYSVVTDPFSDIGYKQEKVEADFCLISHGHFDHNAANNVRGALVVNGRPAQKETEKIFLEQIVTYHDDFKGAKRGENVVHKFTVDGIRFCHMGDIGESFSEETAKRVGGSDVLFIPVGGNYTIDYLNAKKYADAISPKLIVPMHFKTPRSSIDIDGVENFKSLYKSIIEAKGVFSIDKGALDEQKETKVLLFDASKF